MVLVVNITKEQLRAIKNNNILGSGNFSKAYDVSGNEIIKLWKQNAIDMSDNTLFLENMMNVYNKGVDSSIILFPEKLIYLKDIFVGYMREKSIGEELNVNMLLNYEIENVYNLIILLEQELERIAIDYNIKAGDIKFKNMIYNENQNLINIIDTDHFTVSNKDKYKIAKYNLNRLKLSLSTQLSRTGCLSNIKDKETRNILGNLIANDDLKFSDLIYSIKEKENVRTLNGLKRK